VRDLGLSKDDRILQKTALTFDAAGWEIFAPLVVGGAVVLAPPGAEHDPELMLRAVGEHGVTVLQVVPSVLRLLVESSGWPRCGALRLLFCAGEPLTAELCARVRELADVVIYNTYGPTECSIDATGYRYRPEQAAGPVAVGRPIPNMRAVILDPAGRRVAESVTGELHLGGTGLGRGYLGRPGLTADRFVPDPFGPRGARLYRTGDLARWRADGNIEFVGRLDAQVKVNGVRIEPAEVEAALSAHPAVREAAVATVGEAGGGRRLVGYVVPATPAIDLAQVRRFLLTRLPAAMIPAALTVLDSLPLTPSGKLDRAALPAPAPRADARAAPYIGPATHAEQAVASVWAELLGRERVGLRTDFFELGGHSLLFARLAAKLRARYDIDIDIAALYTATTVEAQARLAAERPEAAAPIERLPRDRPFQLSSGQDRMWFLDQLDPGSTEFVVPLFASFDDPVDIPVLERALASLVARHEILRTRYAVRDGAPVQIVGPPFRVPVRRLAIHAADQAGPGIARLVARELAQPFDLERGPILRCLVAEGGERHVVILAVHHIACDGWSMRLLERDLCAAYAAAAAGRPVTPPVGQPQYADYASWQKQRLMAPGMCADLEYWCAQLAGIRPLELPTDYPRPAEWSGRGRTLAFTVPSDVAASVIRFGRRHAATPFMTLLAVYQILLARLTRTIDIVVGTPVTGRSHPQTEEIVGFFVNNLVLRTDLSGDPDFAEVLARTRKTALAAYARQEVPFELLVERLGSGRDPSRKPLFQTMFSFGAEALPSGLTGAVAGMSEIPWPTASFEVTVSLAEREDGSLHGLVEYATDLFESATIERLIGEYVSLLESVAAHPDVPAVRLGAEASEQAPPAAGGVPEAFAAQVARSPDSVAITQADRALSYAELGAWVDHLATRLRSAGVECETPVGVCLGRSPELVAAMLGVMRAGGVYVPVDPDAPPQWREAVMVAAGINVVVTDGGLAGQLGAGGRRVVAADQHGQGDQAHLPETGPTDPGTLAYVVHTSGSTGRPKGVMVSHGAFLSHLRGIIDVYNIRPDDTMVMLCAPAFDVAVEQIGSALLAGARLVLADRELWSPAELPARIAEQRITKLDVTPAYLRELLDAIEPSDARLNGLNLLNVGSDVVFHEDIQRLLAAEWPARLVCTYGPTETTVTATLLDVGPAETAGRSADATVAIGRPLHDTRAYVLGNALERAGNQVPGELYLAGPRLARGYLGRPDLTADRFVPDPFAAGEGARMYRTGDRVRRRADGVLEFLGRIDDQVKIRGFRVEPGEIEAALTVHPEVREACVVARSSGAGRHLVAHVVAKSAADPRLAHDLAAYLRGRLPGYMVPDRWALHDTLPRTVSGKIDRRALTVPGEVLHAEPGGHGRVQDPVEARIAAIWSAVLGVERVGRHDDFFRLGGNSLLATRAHIRLKEAFGIDLPLRQFFDTPSVAGLGGAVRQVIESEVASLSDDQVKRMLR
jgi:amino acid adenylation domain-containing protein